MAIEKGKTYRIKQGEFQGQEFRLEDKWITIYGKSWMMSDGNPAALEYAARKGTDGLPFDDDVYYGKIGAFGHLVHEKEIGELVEASS